MKIFKLWTLTTCRRSFIAELLRWDFPDRWSENRITSVWNQNPLPPKNLLALNQLNSNPNPPSSTPRRCFKFDLWATILFFPNAIFGLTYKNQRFLLHGICTRKQIWKSDLLRNSETPETGELKTKQETNLYTLIFLDICSKCLQVCLIERRSWKNEWFFFFWIVSRRSGHLYELYIVKIVLFISFYFLVKIKDYSNNTNSCFYY